MNTVKKGQQSGKTKYSASALHFFEGAPQGFAILNRQGELEFANQAFRTMLGIKGPSDALPEWASGLRKLGAEYNASELEAPRENGLAERRFQCCSFPLPAGEPGLPGSFGLVLQEIPSSATDAARGAESHLEKLVRERTAQLEASTKELEAFSYSVSHDLRAPLRSISGFSQALVHDFSDKLDDKAREYLMRIQKSTNRLSQLIEDLLQFSRVARSEFRPQRLNVSSMAAMVLEELQRRDPGRRVAVSIEPDMQLYGDERLVRMLLDIFLGNAWKFTSKTANASIEFKRAPSEPGDTFLVRDNGAGFDTNFADKLFRPFQRLHSVDEFPGNGIGLAIAKRILARHEGKAWATSGPEPGATFYFQVPPGK